MANYCCAVRTNYFHVKNSDAFRDFMKNVEGCEDKVDVWEKTDSNGDLVFGFGCYGGISGYFDHDEDITDDEADCDYEAAYDRFIDGLKEHVAENDAVIIMESGNEKLRYLVGQAEIITSEKYDFVDLMHAAISKAVEMLGNDAYNTSCSY